MPHPKRSAFVKHVGVVMEEQRAGFNYFKPTFAGVVTCTTEVISRGKSVAHLESSVHSARVLVAKASGNYAIFRPSNRDAT